MLWTSTVTDFKKALLFMMLCASIWSTLNVEFKIYQTTCCQIQRWKSWVLLGSSILPTMLIAAFLNGHWILWKGQGTLMGKSWRLCGQEWTKCQVQLDRWAKHTDRKLLMITWEMQIGKKLLGLASFFYFLKWFLLKILFFLSFNSPH